MCMTHATRSMPGMAGITPTARVPLVLAWLDQVELAACRRLNGVIGGAGTRRLFQAASRLGDGILWYLVITALALGYGEAGRQAAMQCALAGISGLVLYRFLKNRLVRERPYMTHAAIICAGKPLDRFSFPSGHTLHAVSFTLIAVAAVPMLALLLVPAALLIALSRVVLGLHYPSDVLAGALLGAAVARVSMAIFGA